MINDDDDDGEDDDEDHDGNEDDADNDNICGKSFDSQLFTPDRLAGPPK